MRLIHGIETDLHALQEIDVLILLQTLRSQVQQFRLAFQHVFFHGIDLTATKAGIDKMRHALLFRVVTHSIHLVLHQCDKRRDDNRHTVHDHRRQLVAQTLSAAGRHQHERVFAFHHIADNSFLIAFEGVESEVHLQRFH